MANKELKEEIKTAKRINKSLKKLNKKTQEKFGALLMDPIESIVYVGNNTYVKTYYFKKNSLSENEKKELISYITNIWKNRVRISVINAVNKDRHRIQIYVLTVYFTAYDYYNSRFEMERFEQGLSENKVLSGLQTTASSLLANFYMSRQALGLMDSKDYSVNDLLKKSWNTLLFDECKEKPISLTLYEASSEHNFKEIIKSHLESFILTLDITPFEDMDTDVYKAYIENRYNNSSNINFENFSGVYSSISTVETQNILKLKETLRINNYTFFVDVENSQYINNYSLGIRDYHNKRLMQNSKILLLF